MPVCELALHRNSIREDGGRERCFPKSQCAQGVKPKIGIARGIIY